MRRALAAACVLASAVVFSPVPLKADTPDVVQPKSVNQVGNGQFEFGMMAVAWMPDGRHVMTTSYGGHTIFWDATNGRIIENRGQGSCELRRDPSGQGAVHRSGLTNCLSPEVLYDPQHYLYLQPQSLHVSPDGRFAIQVAFRANTTQEDLNDLETMIYGLYPRGTKAWVRGRPRLWIGGTSSRLILAPGPPNACPPVTCRLSILDPVSVTETALDAEFGDGRLMAVSRDSERFAAVVAGPDGGDALTAWSAADLRQIGRFPLAAKAAEIGFDKAGGRVFARTANGKVSILALDGQKSTVVAAAGVIGTAEVLLTDIDARAFLLRGKSGQVRLVSFGGRLLAAPAGAVRGLFAHQGAVLEDANGDGLFLDLATAKSYPLHGPILPSVNFAPDIDGIDALVGPNLALSPDGSWLASAAGWAEPVKTPGLRTHLSGFDVLQFPTILPSPDGRKFAAMPDNASGDGGRPTRAAWVFDFDAGRLSRAYPATEDPAATPPSEIMGWMRDGRLVIGLEDGHYRAVDVDSGSETALANLPPMANPYDQRPSNGGVPTCRPATPKPSETLSDPVKALCYTWEWSGDGSLNFKSAYDWKPLLTLYLHPDRTWLAGGPNYTYDTNGAAETSDIRWLMPGQPWSSLPVQTFMRQLFQPGLASKVLDCNARRNCESAFRAPTNLGALNLALPQIAAISFPPGAPPGRVLVDVAVKEGRAPGAASGDVRSGVYDLRLLRDGKLVDQWPAPPPGVDETATTVWRANNRILAGPHDLAAGPAAPAGPDGLMHRIFSVALPTGPAGVQSFGAYAFNEDRVKSETETVQWRRPASPRVQPRAYVLSIGADIYDNTDWTLRFAGADAVLMARTLHDAIQHYDVHAMTLVSQVDRRQATLGLIHDALSLLGRADGEPGQPAVADQAAARARLAEAGVANTAGFQTATPDDLVIITFAGHGWTSEKGEFYLVPSDGKVTPDGRPNPFTFISAGQLTDWLRPVDAGETAIVIDACHSAASVEAPGFKPAPLGDPGLGQLAYDKDIRILAASQSDAVAMEDEGLGHGLLTYALAQEALGGAHAGDATVTSLKARLFGGGTATLDAWLAFAARRLPSLSAAVMAARQSPPQNTGDIVFDPPSVLHGAAAPVQAPQFFDFTGQSSVVTLKAADIAHPSM